MRTHILEVIKYNYIILYSLVRSLLALALLAFFVPQFSFIHTHTHTHSTFVLSPLNDIFLVHCLYSLLFVHAIQHVYTYIRPSPPLCNTARYSCTVSLYFRFVLLSYLTIIFMRASMFACTTHFLSPSLFLGLCSVHSTHFCYLSLNSLHSHRIRWNTRA